MKFLPQEKYNFYTHVRGSKNANWFYILPALKGTILKINCPHVVVYFLDGVCFSPHVTVLYLIPCIPGRERLFLHKLCYPLKPKQRMPFNLLRWKKWTHHFESIWIRIFKMYFKKTYLESQVSMYSKPLSWSERMQPFVAIKKFKFPEGL